MSVNDFLTDQAGQALRGAAEIAFELRHPRATPAHLLVAVCRHSGRYFPTVLEALKTSASDLRAKVLSQIGSGSDGVASVQQVDVSPLAPVLLAAEALAREQGVPQVDADHLFFALTTRPPLDEQVNDILQSMELLPNILRDKWAEAIRVWAKIGDNLTKEAAVGRLGPVVGRDSEIGRLAGLLEHPLRRLPLLVGDGGVGKTAIVEGLAEWVVRGKLRGRLQNVPIISVRLERLLLKKTETVAIIEHLMTVARQKQAVLFFDDFDSILNESEQVLTNCRNLLLRGHWRGVRRVAAVSSAVYLRHVQPHPWIRRRVDPIRVSPLSVTTTFEAIQAARPMLEKRFKLTLPDDLVYRVVTLAARASGGSQLPGTAFRLLEDALALVQARAAGNQKPVFQELTEAIASFQVRKETSVAEQDFEKAAAFRDKQNTLEKVLSRLQSLLETTGEEEPVRMSPEGLTEPLAMASGLVPLWVAPLREVGERLRRVRQVVEETVVGQPEAVAAIFKQVSKLLVGGQTGEGQPLATFLFVGPSGTGKSLLTQLLATHLFGGDRPPVCVDLRRFRDHADLPRLVEELDQTFATRGVLPTDDARAGGVLTLDHLDSGHPAVQDWLTGWLCDRWGADGRDWSAGVRRWVVVVTTRGGVDEVRLDAARPVTDRDLGRRGMDAEITRYLDRLPTDLVNRFTEVVRFATFRQDAVARLLDAVLGGIAGPLGGEGITLTVDSAARDWLVRSSQIPELGARAVAWRVDHSLRGPLAEFLFTLPSERPIEVQVGLVRDPAAGPRLDFRPLFPGQSGRPTTTAL